jgi:hypothetical protein
MADDFSFGTPGAGAQYTAGHNPPAAPSAPRRQPLGLPRGSVRALMILMIVGTIVTLLAMPPEKQVSVPIYMYYLLFLTTGAYFSGRGAAPPRKVTREAAPLGLPRGSIRFLLIAAVLGGIGWGVYQAVAENKFDDFLNRLVTPPGPPKLPVPTEVGKTDPDKDEKKEEKKEEVKEPELSVLDKINLLTPLIILGAFYFGVLAEGTAKMVLAGEEGLPGWYQDIQAWLSIVAMLALGAEVIFQLVVFPSMPADKRFALPQFQTFLAAMIAFYFGARS